MENSISAPVILEALIFLMGNGGQTSSYAFDRYITIHIPVEGRQDAIPQKLLEEGLIKIHRETNNIQVRLSDKGYEKIEKFYVSLDFFLKKVKYDLVAKLMLKNEIQLQVPMLWFKHKSTSFTIKIIEFENLTLKLNIHSLSKYTLKTELIISEVMVSRSNFLMEIIKSHIDLIDLDASL